MLDLPTWLAITRVYCNRAAIRIQWTKLKTHPICLMLDKVEIEMKTCEEPRPPNGPSPIALASGQSEYGFAEKVVEGMFLEIGCVSIKIQSRTFRASLQLWQLQGYSVSPNWQQSDLRFTRLTHSQRGEVLTFKQVTWQTLRIEADASESCDDAPTTPLRLLTNGGRLNVALKRRTKDCMVLSSKLSIFLDELLWVLTDSQLRALLSYTKSLGEAVQKSVRQRKQLGEPQVLSPTTPPPWSFPPPPSSFSSLGQYFEKFDVKETSYHLLISKLELHVCDESQAKGTVSGGAIQVTLRRITLDYYPTHRAGQSCAHWNRFSSAMGTCEQWIQELAQERLAKEDCDGSILSGKMPSPKHGSAGSSASSLYFRSVLMRIDDLHIHQVSFSGQSPQKPPLISCSHIPVACSAVHLQYTEYFRLPGDSLSVPPPALYIQLHGLLLYLAAQSILWLKYFMLDLSHHLQQFAAVRSIVNEEAGEHRDMRLDGFNLKLYFPVPPPSYSSPERPSSVCAHLTSVTLTNTRQALGSTIDLLQNTFRSFAAHEIFHCPPGPLHPAFLSHVYPSTEPPSTSLWSLHSPGLSLHFEGSVPKHQILLQPMPFTAWVCLLLSERQLQVMLNVDQMVRLQLDHYHYLTLLRLQEQVQALLEGFQKMANSPSDFTMQMPPPFPSVCVGLLIPVVTISLLLPSSHSPVQPEDSERSSLIGYELTDGDTGSEREKNKLISVNKNEVMVTLPGLEPGQASQMEIVVQQGILSEPDEPIKAEQAAMPVKDSPNKVAAQDITQAKELSVDLFLGKDFARDSLLNTLGLTRETFSLGKERVQRLLGDTKHKDVDATHNQSPPLSLAQSLDTVSIEGLDVLSLDSETTENFLLKLDAELAVNVETALSDQDSTSQSTEGPEPQQILTLVLHNVTSLTRLLGEDISVAVQASDLRCAQRTEDLKGSVGIIPGAPSAPSTSSPRITLKFDLGPSAASFSPLAVRNGFLQLWIKDFSSEIPVSAITHLGPFLEDEKIPEILPMIIQVNNSKITLKDDGPRLYPSPISPEPVSFSLENLRVQRRDDGVFCLIGEESSSPVSKEMDPSFVHISNSSEALLQSVEELQRELLAARTELEQQKQQEERLLKEIWKYNPLFNI
ncbi:bridge-like lipid transfer protein family member 3A isoform X2 [Pyxicephalus adspersus]